MGGIEDYHDDDTAFGYDAVAAFDQAAKAFEFVAQVVAAYWRRLREEGVGEYECLELARSLADRMFDSDDDG